MVIGRELDAMRRAIAISGFGLGSSSPNPPVGCVILSADGWVVGEGWHERKGEPHAETKALAIAGHEARGGTAVVTLEPCNHHGRTPPCHQALIDAGVRRVVVALLDPTSRGEGGIARLRRAGLDVETGVLADEAALVLRPWVQNLGTGRPWAAWVYAASPTGRCSPPDRIVAAVASQQGADAVLDDSGHVREALARQHGPGMLALSDVDPSAPAAKVLEAMFRAGVRRLLVSGPQLGERAAAAGLLDRVIVHFAGGVQLDPGTPLLPAGWSMEGVARDGDAVRVTAIPPQSTDCPPV